MKMVFCQSNRECQLGIATSTCACQNNSTTQIMILHTQNLGDSYYVINFEFTGGKFYRLINYFAGTR